jgi:hypothetical protein
VFTLCSIRKCFTIKSKTDLTSITNPLTVPQGEEFNNLIHEISKETYKRDADKIRCLEIGSTAEEHLITVEPNVSERYMNSNPASESRDPANQGLLDPLDSKRAYDKSLRTIRDDSTGTRKIIHVGKTIKSKTVPPLLVSMKSTPNGAGYYNFPLDRIALGADSDLQDKIQEFLDIYYSGDTED